MQCFDIPEDWFIIVIYNKAFWSKILEANFFVYLKMWFLVV